MKEQSKIWALCLALVPLMMAAHVEYAVTVQRFTSRLRTLSPINCDAVLNIHLDEIANIILMRSVSTLS